MSPDLFSFRLSSSFLDQYRSKDPVWGWTDEAGNSLGEITFVRTYSRVKEDGSKERWWEVCERVINGMFSLQKDHCKANRLEWNGNKAQASAQDAYDRLFHLKWTPPGRGLAQMGTPLVMTQRNSASLQNCANVSTGDMDRHDPGYVFAWTTEALMLGIGVGFDTLGAGKFEVSQPIAETSLYEIPDTREGWAISVGKMVNSYLKPGKPRQEYDYSLLRPYGTPIKTFGGTASGPEPLAAGLEQLRGVLDGNVGSPLTAKTIVDIQNIIGTFVVAGNARRSAELALGQSDDPDFVNLKNHEVFPDRPWAYMSNNSISATVGMDYSPFVTNTSVNGEPGYVWLDTARNYGRMIDGPDGKDRRVTGFNPCSFSGETLVHTTEGPKTIASLKNRPFFALVDGRPFYSPQGSYITGNKALHRLTTVEGFEVILTEDHELLTANGEWREAGSLSKGDKIRVHDHRSVPFWPGKGSEEEGYLIGMLVGDGTINKPGANSETGLIGVWESADPGSAASLMDAVTDAKEKVYESFPSIRRDVRMDFVQFGGRSRGQWNSSLSRKVYNQWGICHGNKTTTIQIEQGSSEFAVGYLRGMFDADGHVEGWKDAEDYKGASIRLAQSDKASLLAVQRMLLRLGIYSRVYKAREAGTSSLPDGRGGVKGYSTKASWRLVIGADNVPRYASLIGFRHQRKQERLSQIVSSRAFYAKPFEATFESLEFVRDDQVWDLSVSTMAAFDANGMYVHNSEQPLESFEQCCLVEAHLNRADSLEDFLRTLKYAYMYGKTVTLLTTPWEKTNAVMLRNRRIGLSTTGVAGFVDDHGLSTYREWADTGYRHVAELDVIYSEWLGIRESIRKTTLKPSGSVSLLSGATPGVHWNPGGEYFLRAVRFGAADKIWRLLQDAGYTVEDAIGSVNTKVVYFPLHSTAKRTEADVSIYEKIHLAAEAQRWWSDNGVSVTVSFDAKNEIADVPRVLRMYESQLKAVSFLPMGNEVYEQQPYTSITQAEYERLSRTISRVDLDELYGRGGDDALGEAYCTTDVCEIPK